MMARRSDESGQQVAGHVSNGGNMEHGRPLRNVTAIAGAAEGHDCATSYKQEKESCSNKLSFFYVQDPGQGNRL